jgi:predicted transcriptional regulator
MARTTRDVSDAELAVLQVLWDDGSSTIRHLTDTIYPSGGTAKYGTVQKLLERLEDKGFVQRQRGEPAHTFAAAVGRDDLIGRRLQDVAEKLCGGSLTPLLTHLVRSRPLSAAQRRELRELIAELDSPGKGKKPAR